jgi:hypothetical protein
MPPSCIAEALWTQPFAASLIHSGKPESFPDILIADLLPLNVPRLHGNGQLERFKELN